MSDSNISHYMKETIKGDKVVGVYCEAEWPQTGCGIDVTGWLTSVNCRPYLDQVMYVHVTLNES